MAVPQVRWLDQTGGTERELTEGIEVFSSNGSLFTTGYTFGEIGDTDNLPGSGADIWVALYDLSGNLKATTQLSSEAEGTVADDFAHAVDFSGSGNSTSLYVVGETEGDITDNPDREVNRGGTDGFILTYSPTGESLGGQPTARFQFDIGDDGGRDFVYDVEVDGEDVYVVGKSNGQGNGMDAFVAKFTTDTIRNFNPRQTTAEQAEWIEVISTPGSEEAQGVVLSGDELYVTGFTNGDIDGDGEGGNGNTNFWLAKLTDLDAGNPTVEINELESPGEDRAYDLSVSGNDIYIVGETTGFLDRQQNQQDEPENDPEDNLGRRDAWVAKFDGETFSETSQPNWIEQFGSATDDFARGITTFDSNNNADQTTVSVTGYTDGRLNGELNEGATDAWVVELIDDRQENAISVSDRSPAFTQAPIFGATSLTFNEIENNEGEPQVTEVPATPDAGDAIVYVLDEEGTLSARDTEGTLTELTAGTILGTIQAIDQQGDDITYSIDPDSNNGAFALDEITGELTLADPELLTESVILTIEAEDDDFDGPEDNEGNTNSVELIIPVDTVDNDPPIISAGDLVSENVSANTRVGAIKVVDPDGDDVTLDIINDDDRFGISPDGEITLTDEADFSLGDTVEAVEVSADDGNVTEPLNIDFRDLVELDPGVGTRLIGSPEADFARDITSDEGGNLYLGGETGGVLSSAEPPVLRDFFVVGDTLTLRYNKPLDAVGKPSPSDFEASITTVIDNQTIGTSPVTVTRVEIEQQNVILTLSQQATPDDNVSIQYTQPSQDFDDENAIQDRFGNDAINFRATLRDASNLTGEGGEIPELPEEPENQEENAGGLDVWFSRLGDNDPAPADQRTETDEDPEPTQSVFTNIDEFSENQPIFQDSTVTLNVSYTATDVDDEGEEVVASGLSGLGLRMHFNSSLLTPTDAQGNPLDNIEDSIVNQAPNFIEAPQIQNDANNFDGDGSTDQFILLSWQDINSNWPGLTEGDPTTDLFNVSFTTARDLGGEETTIRFTASSTAEGFNFSSDNATIAPERYTYDIDGNGQADALTDGIQIIRHLFEPDSDAVESAIASNATRDLNEDGDTDTDDIKDYLNLTRQGGNFTPFDVDGDGEEDANTDGIMIARYMFGFRGEALTNNGNLIDTNDLATRTTPGEIETYIQDFLPG